MTSYSQKIRDGQLGSLIWEVRTVNHRFLEINLRCPEIFRDQEMLMRECVQKHLSRGKVDANLKFVPSPDLPVDFLINTALLEKLSEAPGFERVLT